MQAGAHLLAAYELSGQCAPEVIRRLGITEGNREVLSLGMTMPQLIDAARFNPRRHSGPPMHLTASGWMSGSRTKCMARSITARLRWALPPMQRRSPPKQ